MSSVLMLIIIPDKDYEEEIREKERLSSRLFNKKDQLKTIKENEDNERRYPIEKIVEDGLSYLGIVDASWNKSKNDRYYTISFPVDLEDSDAVLQYFKTLGIGLRLDTSIGIIPFSLFCYNEELGAIADQEIILENGDKDMKKSIGNFKEKQSKFLKSVTARLTVAQVVDNVRSNAALTFDFVCYIVFASWIAAMGLLENSVISLVASMLVSPMMGPVMSLSFGVTIKEWSLIRVGFKNILVCFGVTIAFGYFFGLICLNFTESWGDWAWPTDFMRERGMLRLVWVGTLVAFPSGCAVAISLLSGNEASLVGVAISVSLLPPNVNAGLHWAYGTLKGLYSIGQEPQLYQSQFTNDTIWLKPALAPHPKYSAVYSDNMGIESFLLGLVSVLFSAVNVTNIILGSLLLLKIKEIAPLATMSPENRRFFQEDIKIAREYNEKSRGSNNLGEDVLKEWATIAGLDKDEFLKPESRAVRLQTLADIARDVEADLVYQTVTRNMAHMPTPGDNLARRLSHIAFTPSNLIRDDRIRGSLRSSASMPRTPTPQVVVSDVENNIRPPSSTGGNRRRISTVALNNYFEKEDNQSNGRSPNSAGHATNAYTNTAFSFNESDIHNHNLERSRRYSSALLRRTLQTAEHSPYSLWPSTRPSPLNPPDKFTVTPVSENPMKLSIPQLNKFD